MNKNLTNLKMKKITRPMKQNLKMSKTNKINKARQQINNIKIKMELIIILIKTWNNQKVIKSEKETIIMLTGTLTRQMDWEEFTLDLANR